MMNVLTSFLSGQRLLAATLDRIIPLSTRRDLVIDAEPLEFIDHRGLLALDRHARAHHRTVTLRTGSPTIAKMTSLLPFEALRVAGPPGAQHHPPIRR